MPEPPSDPKPLVALPVAPPDGGCCGTEAGDAPCSGDGEGPRTPTHRPVDVSVHWVAAMRDTPAGPVAVVRTALDRRDRLGTAAVRVGFRRYSYTVPPGLYAAGHPTPEAPVLVSANYKLSFDLLRRQLDGIDAWILVIETFGINVWCAAGKGTFGHAEVIRRVAETRLTEVVRHRELILPQLAAPGVDARAVRRACGFTVRWGPVRAADIPAFLAAGGRAAPGMRRVTFAFGERLVLIPVELSMLVKPALGVLVVVFLLSGIGPDLFSLTRAWPRAALMAAALAAGVLAGAVATPALLPWLPGRMFAVKGGTCGAAVAAVVVSLFGGRVTPMEAAAAVLSTTALGSFMAMNFTGSTPFTSPSGVEKEMRRSLPVQILAVAVAVVLWLGSAFAA